jgi:NTP pyrophosphatase (non-canonical NTP hydrolase)
MEFNELIKKAKKIKEEYHLLNRVEGHKHWGLNEYFQGLLGDVGDLSKLLMAKKGYRFEGKDVDEQLEHELADCLWSIIVIADELDIDLERAFLTMTKKLEKKIQEKPLNSK